MNHAAPEYDQASAAELTSHASELLELEQLFVDSLPTLVRVELVDDTDALGQTSIHELVTALLCEV